MISVDDAATDGQAGVIAAIRDHEPGDEIPVVVVRDGEEQTFDVTLVERAQSDPTLTSARTRHRRWLRVPGAHR